MAIHLRISETDKAYAVIRSVKERFILLTTDWLRIRGAAETHRQIELVSIGFHNGVPSNVVVCTGESSDVITLFADNDVDIEVWLPEVMIFGATIETPPNVLA